MQPGDIVLVDTNVIIEGYTRSCWAALTGAYRVQTVDRCIVEAMTGRYDWNGTKPPENELRITFNSIHSVTPEQLAEVALTGGSSLDPGERELWAHALARTDAWILCGPDRASLRFGYEHQLQQRLVSLGALLHRINFRTTTPLRAHFEQPWHADAINKLVLGIL